MSNGLAQKKWWLLLVIFGVVVWLCWPASSEPADANDPTTMFLPGKLGVFYRYFEGEFVGATGLSPWLARAIAGVLVIPLVWSIPRMTSFWSQQREKAIAVGLGVMIVFSAIMFGVTQRRNFDPKTGSVRKWYADTPEGRRFFDQDGYDPKYGVKLEPVSKEIVQVEYRQQNSLAPRRVNTSNLSESDIFDRITGAPRYWYHKTTEGEIELFDNEGRHPLERDLLKPITREIADEYQHQIDRQLKRQSEGQRLANQRRYVVASSRSQQPMLAIVAANGTNECDEPLADFVAKNLRLASGIVTTEGFLPAFVEDGLHQRLNRGERQVLVELNADQACEFVMLVTSTTKVDSINTDYPDLRSVQVKLEFQVWDCVRRIRKQRENLTAKGAGFSIDAARNKALERIGADLNELTWSFKEDSR